MKVFEYFARKCFGARGERLVRALIVCAIVYGSLAATDWHIQIAPFVLCLMAGVVSGGVTLRALTARDNACELHHILMLPLSERAVIGGYVSAMAAYVLVTKTLPLLALLFAVCDPDGLLTVTTLTLALSGTLLAVLCVCARRRWLPMFWSVFLMGLCYFLVDSVEFLLIVACSTCFAAACLARQSAYALLCQHSLKHRTPHTAKHFLMLRYLLRVFFAHRNYMVNTVALWGVALVLPYFLQTFAAELFIAPLGFAILTLNTPLGTVLSREVALARGLRMLPGGMRRFCFSYATLLVLANLCADALFLLSWMLTTSAITPSMLAAALYIALQSAILSVWLEWRHPLTNWRIESDLWHHPRKYLVAGVMLLLASAIGSWPVLIKPIWLVMAVEGVMIFIVIRRIA